MESLCDRCKKGYNLDERQKIMLNCGNNICLQCFTLLHEPQENKLICPHPQCGETLIINQRFFDNIKKMRENQQGLMIFCEKHQTQVAHNLCRIHSILCCDKCALEDHSDHKQALIEMNRRKVEGFCNTSIKNLNSLKKRIENALESLTAYKSKSKSFISDKMMALVLETQEILVNPHLSNQKQQESLQFPPINQENAFDQEQLEINPQQERKEQPQENFQLDQYQRQQIYALPRPQQQVYFQYFFETEFDEYSKQVFDLNWKKFELLQKWIGRKVKFQLQFRASRDGFDFKNIDTADSRDPNITIIKSEHDQIFGGYASNEWKNEYFSGTYYRPCSKGFLFQLTKETKHEHASFHPDFDIEIRNNCNQNQNSSALRFGSHYKLPENMEFRSKEAECYLAGSPNFKVKEIEIYKVIDQ